MVYKVLDLSKKDKWNSYLSKLPIDQQDIYFTPEYYELYEKNGDGKAQCFVSEYNGEIALYPFLINSVNELGYKLDKEYFDIQGAYGYNGIVSTSYDEDFITSFYNEFNLFCQNGNIIAEFTRFNPLLGNYRFSDSFMDVIYDRKTVYLNLEKTYDDIWTSQYSSINRNMIRKGRKSLSIKISQNNVDLEKFISIYKYTMQKINAEEYYFFSDIYFSDLLNENIYILNVYDKKTMNILSSMILMVFRNYAHYHLSGRSETCKNNSVNNFILDEAIKFAIRKSCKLFHFGGGNTSKENDGLLKFKQKFSKERGDFYIGKKVHNKKIYDNVIKQWKNKYPDKIEKNKNLILKYRIV